MSALFLKSCCRVCLVQEHIMIFLYDRVDEFNATLSELLETCAGLKINNMDLYTKLICKECTEELLMVAKFREKCKTSEQTLNELTQNLDADELSKLAAADELVLEDFHPQALAATIDDVICDDDDAFPSAIAEDAAQQMVEYMQETDTADDFDNTDNDDLFCRFIEEDATNDVADDSVQNEPHDGDDDEGDEYPAENQPHIEEEPTEADPVDTNEAHDYDPSSVEQQSMPVAPIKTAVINHNCDVCGAGFMHLNNLRKHLQTHLDDAIGTDATDTNELSVLYECSTCTMMFTSCEEYTAHTESHRTEAEAPTTMRSKPKRKAAGGQRKRSATSGIPSAMATDPRQNNDPPKDHKCLYCTRSFPSNSLLGAHVRIHTGERPYACDQCPKAFTTRGGLDLHMRRHLGIKPFECPFCQRRFVESSNLRVHLRTHTGEKPHQCNHCSRSFSRVFLLQIHQRTHSGERPYACDVCDKAFAQQGDLAAHKRIHTGERPHRCKVCGRGFIKSSALTPHMRMHERNADGALGGNSAETDGTDDNSKCDVKDEYEDCGSEVLMEELIEEPNDGSGYMD